MKTNKILLSLFTLLTIVFFGCKEDEPEIYALNVDNMEIFQNETYKFYVENYLGSITWSIDDDKIASIDQNGQVRGLRVGTTIVHAYLSNGMHFMSSLTVTQSAIELPFKALQLSTTKDYNNPIPTKFILTVSDSTYLDESKYPLHITLNKLQNQATPSLMNESEEERELLETTINAKLRTEIGKLPAGYDIEVIPGEEEAKYYCKLELGPYYVDFDITVDYGVYLSHTQINPENLNEGIALLSYKRMLLEEQSTLDYNFFCYLDGASDEQIAKVRQIISNKESYKFEDLNMVIGDITIDESEPVWKVNVPLSVETNEYQAGTVTLSIEDKDLVLDLTIDDGKQFKELYVSFESIYTYNENFKLNSRSLEKAYVNYIGGDSPEAGIGDVITMDVFYTMAPDDRGDFIDWKVNVPEGAPVRYIGNQRINTQRFEFDFEVVSAGKSTIEITVENPKADDPKLTSEEKAMYEEYRIQTLSALVDVKDRAEVEVEEVMFLKDESSGSDVITEDETYLKVYNLYSYVTPEESAGAWPAVYSVECSEGAEAEATQIGYSEELKSDIPGYVTVKHAGKIVVTATAKDKTATLTLTAKMKINQLAEGEKLTLKQQHNGDYAPGETDKIITKLNTYYTVYGNEYTWTSSNPDVISVDAEGNITAIADGTATITASITDDSGYTATASIELTVRTISADANFNNPEFADHYVIKIEDDWSGVYYIDLPEGGPEEMMYVLRLDRDLQGNGVYTAGSDFEGYIESTYDSFEIVGGTITISGGKWTFNLQVENENASGTITGTKPYMFIGW